MNFKAVLTNTTRKVGSSAHPHNPFGLSHTSYKQEKNKKASRNITPSPQECVCAMKTVENRPAPGAQRGTAKVKGQAPRATD